MAVEIPKFLHDEAVRRGIDLEDLLIMALSDALRLDPAVAARARLELAVKYLEEGRALVDKDPCRPVRSFIRLLRRLSRR